MTVEEAKRKFYNNCCGECDDCHNYNPNDIHNSGCDLVDELLEEVNK